VDNLKEGPGHPEDYRAQELEEQVWQEVRNLLRDPDRLRAGMDTVIEMHRSALRGSPEQEAKTLLEKLAEVDRKRARYQEMAAEELITLDELREKLADLEETRSAAERALEEVQGRAGRISELERDRDALLESFEALAPEELDDLTQEERHGFYRTLRVVVYVHREGGVEVTGELTHPASIARRTTPQAAHPAATGQARAATAPALLLEGFPQIKTRQRSLWPPGPGERPQIILVRQPRQPVRFFDRPADAKVPDRQHVRPPEVEHQEHISTPLPNALDRDEP
jgi:hypothetical protein